MIYGSAWTRRCGILQRNLLGSTPRRHAGSPRHFIGRTTRCATRHQFMILDNTTTTVITVLPVLVYTTTCVNLPCVGYGLVACLHWIAPNANAATPRSIYPAQHTLYILYHLTTLPDMPDNIATYGCRWFKPFTAVFCMPYATAFTITVHAVLVLPPGWLLRCPAYHTAG